MNTDEIKIWRCGRFRKRMFRFRWSGTSVYAGFIKSFDPEIEVEK
jgi:hypothetical protein